MEIYRNSAAPSHEYQGSVVKENPPVTPDFSTSLVGVGERRYPDEGWIEVPLSGVAILHGIRKYVDLTCPDGEPATVRIHPGDEVAMTGGERYALEGPGQVLVINSPAQQHDQVKRVQ